MNVDAQRKSALEAANRIRLLRAGLKLDLKASKPGSRKLAHELLGDLPEWLQTYRLPEFLKLFPGIGKTRARTIMSRMVIKGNPTLGQLSEKRRIELAIHIAQTGAP